jgi:hypothetical protein
VARTLRDNQSARVGVSEQEGELVLDVAVADVEGCYPGAIAGNHGLEVFGAVAQINSQVVLPGFMPRQILSFSMTAQSRNAEICGEGVDTAINLAICQAAFPPHQHFLIRNSAGHGGEDRRQVEDGGAVHGPSWLWLGDRHLRASDTGNRDSNPQDAPTGLIGHVGLVPGVGHTHVEAAAVVVAEGTGQHELPEVVFVGDGAVLNP